MKIYKNKRFFIVFAIIVCVSLLSCGDTGGNDNSGGTNNNDGNTNTGGDDIIFDGPRELTPDSLPDDLDFDGETIRIMHRMEWDIWEQEIAVESEIGEVVNDAIYNRNKSVEDRLNVNIQPIPSAGGYPWQDNDFFNNTVRNSVLAGSDDYDLIAGYAYFIPVLATEGLLYNWNSVKYISPEKEWWCAGYNDQMTIDGKLYFITGDIALTMLKNMFVIYYNKDVVKNLGLEDMYAVAFNGDFTLDKIAEIIKGIYMDMDGSGVPNDKDMYGFAIGTGNPVDVFYNAFDQPIIQKDREGIPQIVLNSQKTIDIVDKLYGFFFENQDVFAIDENLAGNRIYNMFIENRLLFMPAMLHTSESLRSVDIDYGILPYPKWNKDQPAYYTTAQNSYSLFSIPITCRKTDAVGATVEALCAESYRKVTPAYYEIALKQKYSRDEETSRMLDLIRAGMTFDFGVLNSISMDNIQNIFRNLMTGKSRDFVSEYEKGAAVYQSQLDKLIEGYQNQP